VDHMALLYLGPKTPNFKENNKVATFFLGIWFFSNL
jgi:hypothetical protein